MFPKFSVPRFSGYVLTLLSHHDALTLIIRWTDFSLKLEFPSGCAQTMRKNLCLVT
jgi:hypothetical protein